MSEVKKIAILPLKAVLKDEIENISKEYSEYAIVVGLDLLKVDDELVASIENNEKENLIDLAEISKKYVKTPFCVNINCKNLNEFISVEDKFKLLAQDRFLFVSSENKKILKYIKSNYCKTVVIFMTAFDVAKFYFFNEIGLNFLLNKIEGDAVLIPERSGLVKFSRNSFISKLKELNISIFIYTDKNIKDSNYDYASGFYLLIN